MPVSHQTRLVVDVPFECGCSIIYLFDLLFYEEAKEWAHPMVPSTVKAGYYWVADETHPGEADNYCGKLAPSCNLAGKTATGSITAYETAKADGLKQALEYLKTLETL